jgi:hypothetical protein
MSTQDEQSITIKDGQSAQPLSPQTEVYTIEIQLSDICQGLDVASGVIATTVSTAAEYLGQGKNVNVLPLV